jgi:hypothetical protein
MRLDPSEVAEKVIAHLVGNDQSASIFRAATNGFQVGWSRVKKQRF